MAHVLFDRLAFVCGHWLRIVESLLLLLIHFIDILLGPRVHRARNLGIFTGIVALQGFVEGTEVRLFMCNKLAVVFALRLLERVDAKLIQVLELEGFELVDDVAKLPDL